MITKQKKYLFRAAVILVLCVCIGNPANTFAAVKKPSNSKPKIVILKKVAPKKVTPKIVQKAQPIAKIETVLPYTKNTVCEEVNTYPNGQGVVRMITYTGENVSRSDTTVTFGGITTQNSSIQKGNTVYGWSGNEGTKQTIDTKYNPELDNFLDEMDKNKSNKPNPQSPTDQTSCKSWVIDSSKFVVPVSVNFVDIGQFPTLNHEQMESLRDLMNH